MTDLVVRCRDCNLRFLSIEDWQQHWPICPCRWDAENPEPVKPEDTGERFPEENDK